MTEDFGFELNKKLTLLFGAQALAFRGQEFRSSFLERSARFVKLAES